MSIRTEIAAQISEGRLAIVSPMLAGLPQPRVIYATAELMEELNGPWADPAVEGRMGRLRADLDLFTTGGLIVVSRGKESSAYMKHLDPPGDGIWEIRSRDPKPSLRVFGRFAATDVLWRPTWQTAVS